MALSMKAIVNALGVPCTYLHLNSPKINIQNEHDGWKQYCKPEINGKIWIESRLWIGCYRCRVCNRWDCHHQCMLYVLLITFSSAL